MKRTKFLVKGTEALVKGIKTLVKGIEAPVKGTKHNWINNFSLRIMESNISVNTYQIETL